MLSACQLVVAETSGATLVEFPCVSVPLGFDVDATRRLLFTFHATTIH